MLTAVRSLAARSVEPTLFGITGRGYYENPASDLLGFYLHPDKGHGLGTLFLKSLLECIPGIHAEDYPCIGVTVEREVKVADVGRIDLLVQASNWILVIENKIWHHQANPFEAYENYARNLRPGFGPLLLVVLSPEGSTKQDRWSAVSYQRLFQALRPRLVALEAQAASKWLLFAREWILHLELELYTPAMTPEQIDFADRHLQELEQAKDLYLSYRSHFMGHLKSLLEQVMPGEEVHGRDAGGLIRCAARSWGRSDMAMGFKHSDQGLRFQITVYLMHGTQDQKEAAQAEFRDQCRMSYDEGGTYGMWRTVEGFAGRAEAEALWVRLGKFIASLHPDLRNA